MCAVVVWKRMDMTFPETTLRLEVRYRAPERRTIDDAQFEAVSEEKKRRSNLEYDETGVHRKSTRYTVKIKINHEDAGV